MLLKMKGLLLLLVCLKKILHWKFWSSVNYLYDYIIACSMINDEGVNAIILSLRDNKSLEILDLGKNWCLLVCRI